MPECPPDMEYLVEWIHMLHGRSGATMSGVAPLSYTVLESFVRLMDIGELHPLEVEALVLMDAAMFTGNEPTAPEETILPKTQPEWPKRKGS